MPCRSRLVLLAIIVAAFVAAPAQAKKKGGGGKGAAPSARAMSELAGKFKWGMNPE